jgi:hypothetical protein
VQKGLEITFRPNKTSGIPGELTKSFLHIKFLPNATALSYTVPLHAKILLTPTFNPSNSTSASINSISNFTATVISPLTIQEHLVNFVKDWFNPLTGIVTTLYAIGSGILGWRFGIRQKNKAKRLDMYWLLLIINKSIKDAFKMIKIVQELINMKECIKSISVELPCELYLPN